MSDASFNVVVHLELRTTRGPRNNAEKTLLLGTECNRSNKITLC